MLGTLAKGPANRYPLKGLALARKPPREGAPNSDCAMDLSSVYSQAATERVSVCPVVRP